MHTGRHTGRIIPAGRPLRVVMVDPNANTPPYDRALSAALAAAGPDVTLVTAPFLYERLEPPNGYTLDERFFRMVGSRAARALRVAERPGLRRALKAAEYPLDWLAVLGRAARRRPDIVHVQWSFEPTVDRLLWSAVRRLGVPLVSTVHNLLPHAAQHGDAERYGRLYRLADGLIVHSERSAAALRERWLISSERIAVAPHGPLFAEVVPVPREAARRALGLPADAELVLLAGLIEPYKGLSDLIDAFARVAARRPRARLVVAGKPNEPFEPYRRQLASLGVEGRTILDLQFLPTTRLASYFCAVDVVALPYRETTASGLLLAARRFASPVVATATGDLAEVIQDGVSGLLVPPSDPAALAVAIERLLVNPELAGRLAAAGQADAFGPQGWAVAAERTLALYSALLRNARRPQPPPNS